MSTTDETAGTSPAEKLRGWFTGRLPAEWFTSAPEIVVDREEITLTGKLPDPETADDEVETAGKE